jgi:large subunit ribosomal protein L5
MYFLKNYYQNTIQYDLINKFHYKNLQNLPSLQKIVLNFGYKNPNLKNLASALLFLELVTTKRGVITTASSPHILLKVKKGNPVGCKVILKKTLMYSFFTKLLIEIYPQMKEFKEFTFQKKNQQSNTFSYQLKNTFVFLELEQNYNLFNTLSNLNITIVTNTKTQNELSFLLNSFKLPMNH